MSRFFPFLLLTLLPVCTAVAQTYQSFANVENVSIQSEALGQEREILIYTPPNYEESKFRYYPVFYVFDAQNQEFFDLTHAMLNLMGDPAYSFIVVGIKATYIEEPLYARNHDLLPVFSEEHQDHYLAAASGNADQFMKYVESEVIPYVESNYRSLPHRTAIGHSLSASFVLYSMLEKPDLFDNHLAISPNLSFDGNRLANGLREFDYSRLEGPGMLYISSADEPTYWKEWGPANDLAFSFLKEMDPPEGRMIVVKEFPTETHRSTFPPSLTTALNVYLKAVKGMQDTDLSEESKEVTITVQVPNANDKLFITGNQEALGNWDPGEVKMEKTSEFERSITLPLYGPAQFKFTKGSWRKEAGVVDGYFENLVIMPEEGKSYHFEVEGYPYPEE